MAPKFGTSGLRGLVTELTDELVGDHVCAFLTACPHGGQVHVGWDLRDSSPAIAEAVIAAVRSLGLVAVREGVLPTPALALASMEAGAAAVMVTGSHIPADRNGLKFYVPTGEISKADEGAILAQLGAPQPQATPGAVRDGDATLAGYADRYLRAFGVNSLSGLRVGIYEHSSVARDVMGTVLRALGAQTVPLARSDTFIPVDTEAVDPDTRTQLASWARNHGLDSIVSTDGDGDRPMVTDAQGNLVLGDVLGPITARLLGATLLVTPVSSNTMVDAMEDFAVTRTRIGSPYVIAAMEAALEVDPTVSVVGYEANGGFLLGFTADGPVGPLSPLMTRDSLLPIVAPLVAARAKDIPLAQLVAALPARFTAADRLQGIAPEAAAPFLTRLSESAGARAAFFIGVGTEKSVDRTDGLRVSFADGEIVHLRPSGNAPEFRCYVEADSPEAAAMLLSAHLDRLRSELG
ncbi:phosphomannomutase [Jannaschia faecimaris]|uniref:Phosphomannomutase n=1 Tax=Jannaschia faecimaris TaxID=1244108 RepID=A0A1H3K8L2_9RHOB|nr:phosphomannomutase [Jannaschia faecimaris]SDY48520.1 phosphomannomutase [Jannaschia faecimaris]